MTPKRFGQVEAITSLSGFHTARYLHLCMKLNVPNIIAILYIVHITFVVDLKHLVLEGHLVCIASRPFG